MNKEQIRKKVIALYKEEDNIEKEIKKLQNELVEQLCPKEKKECEPEYCVFRLSDACPFLKVWRELLEEANVPKDTKYDLFIDFIEKISKNKGLSK